MRGPTTLAAVVLMAGCASIPSPLVQANPKQDAWVLQQNLEWRVGTSRKRIVVPAGFVTDYASIPRPLWSVFPPHHSYSRAAVIHDYLYWTQACTRLQADNLFYVGMVESKVPLATRLAVYWGVRTPFGQAAWDENKLRRSEGFPRVFPPSLRRMFTVTPWPQSQVVARHRGAKDPPPKIDRSVCALGNGTEVPAQ